jgi:hypothetical protein
MVMLAQSCREFAAMARAKEAAAENFMVVLVCVHELNPKNLVVWDTEFVSTLICRGYGFLESFSDPRVDAYVPVNCTVQA